MNALEIALQRHSGAPAIVALQAGDLHTGAYDDFEKCVPVAKKHGAWVHVDGAFGLWAAASARYRHLINGMAGADSWATGGHKWLNVPYDCGYAFVADPEAHRLSLSHRAPYLVQDGDARDQIDWNPEWSRRARGFSTYAALRELGKQGVADLVERCCQWATVLTESIGQLPGAKVLAVPIVNQGLVRFRSLRVGSSEEDHDRRTSEVIAGIVETGEAFFGGTSWRGRRAMRISVCNWRTSEEDVRRVIQALAGVLER